MISQGFDFKGQKNYAGRIELKLTSVRRTTQTTTLIIIMHILLFV